MIPDDPNFLVGFDADGFRSTMRSTMQMGFPNDVALQPTFVWTTQKTYSVPSHGGLPLVWQGATPTSVTSHASTIVPVAVEGTGGDITGLPLGEFNEEKAKVTILDVDYVDTVDTADEMLIGGNRYIIDFVTSVGLADVTIFTLHLSAVDVSA